MAVLSNTALAYSGEVDFPELFKYNDEMNGNLETALHLISTSFNEKGVPVTQELLAAMLATLEKEVGGRYKFLPKEEEGDYGMGPGSTYTVKGSRRSTPYEGGVDYKGRGYIQLTLKSNYEKYCPDCVGTSDENSDICICKNQKSCTETDPTICPQVKALQPERAASIFVSYYLESPSGKNLVSLSNAEKYFEVAHAINVDGTYNSEFETLAKDHLTLFRNNPDKTEKLLSWLNSGTMAAVDVLSIGIPVTLTLYVHDGDPSGSKISSVQVTGQDGAGHSFEQTTNSNGYVTITGIPGTWSFSASANKYETKNWDQEITETDTKDAYLMKSAALVSKGYGSSVVGRWLINHGDGSLYTVTDEYGNEFQIMNQGMYYLEFNKDGTYSGTCRYEGGVESIQGSIRSGRNGLGCETGKWEQSGNRIHCQFGNGKGYEWTINGDTMNGFEIYSDGRREPCSAKRVNPEDFFSTGDGWDG
jgi:hypothetical protein